MMNMRLNLSVLFVCLVFCQSLAYAEPDHHGITIDVKKTGETVIVDANFLVPASLHEVWDVLTDYDHMAKFLPNLQFSKVIAGSANKIQVAQKGRVMYGLLSFSFDNVREVDLAPYHEIRSRLVSGSLKNGTGMTQLTAEGNATRLVYHNESLPGFWLGAAVSLSVVEKASREQFDALKSEILRRKASVGNGDPDDGRAR